MNSISTAAVVHCPPGTDSHAYYVSWLQELSELRHAGLIEDEDYALSRAERLDALFRQPGEPWLKWLLFGLPAALASGVLAMRLTGDSVMFTCGASISVLCLLAAISSYAQSKRGHLAVREKLEVLRDLLGLDLISTDEFAAFEQRILDAK